MSEEQKTLEKIKNAAKEEFLEKGFRDAGLRDIVKKAGVTTGAFYGYFNSKEELFSSLVKESYDYIVQTFSSAFSSFNALPDSEKVEKMEAYSYDYLRDILKYSLTHNDEVKLILTCSEGTRYAFLSQTFTQMEIDATHRYYDTLLSLGYEKPVVNTTVEHMLVSSMFSAFFSLVLCELEEEDAEKALTTLFDFYYAGWARIMGRS